MARWSLADTLQERLFTRIHVDENYCWNWTGAKIKSGYGYCRYMVNGKTKKDLAHRWSYINFVGAIEKGLCVMHTCDNRSCINPSHLKTGSQQENIDDMIKKNRHTKREQKPNSKLTSFKVIEIRKLFNTKKYTHEAIAKRYGVTRPLITDIVNNKRWT